MSATTRTLVFYWGGVDNEDLYCICGEPHPTQVFVEHLPAKMLRRCKRCGAVGELYEDTGEWFSTQEEVK